MTDPLRIGVLGAARINDMTLFPPGEDIGARIVAVAARDQCRAEEYAERLGIARVVDGYQALIYAPEVEAIYNPLPNGLHTRWNLTAIAAGKNVLGGKPFASNAAEAQRVHDAASARPELVVFDGFHCPTARSSSGCSNSCWTARSDRWNRCGSSCPFRCRTSATSPGRVPSRTENSWISGATHIT